jgi:hypothetical protein
MTTTALSTSYDSYSQSTRTPDERQRFWQEQLIAAEKELQKFHKRGNQINARYLDERGFADFSRISETSRRFNLFHANVNIMKAALYSKLPRPEVVRRFKDPDDDVARVAAKILERNLEYELQESDAYDEVFKAVVLDRLIPGLGTCWQRYEAVTYADEVKTGNQITSVETIESESTPIDYVYWEDLFWSPARTWKEVWWIARRVYLGRDEGVKRFGEEFKKVPLDKVGSRSQDTRTGSGNPMGPKNQTLKKGCVYEIWNKKNKTVLWIAKGCPKPLDEKKDFLHLPGFFPTPKPLFASLTTTNLIPSADYLLCQDQYEELDVINTRISFLVQACKVVGVYDKKADGVQRMLNQASENQLIPVDQWAAFAEKGGLKGCVDWLPLEIIAAVIQQLNLARDTIKQQIYELTGLADIIRGASQASETAAAQKIKAQYASVRLTTQQDEVAYFFSRVFNIKACLMAKYYQPEKLLRQAGTLPQEDQQFAEPALQMLKEYYDAKFRILVTADSFTDVDWQREKEERMEFLVGASQFIEKAATAAESAPETAQMMFGLLKFAVAGFRASRDVEGIIDAGAAAAMQAQQQRAANPEPDPEQQKIQAEMQANQQKVQADMQSAQQKHQLEMAKLQAELEADKAMNQAKLSAMQAELEFAREKHALEMQALREKYQLQAQGELIKAQTKISADTALSQQKIETQAAQHDQSLEHSEQDHQLALKQAAEQPKETADNK